ncbi:MAG TPA: glycosyltransferase family 1 protein [Chloroflexia bacterium]|nr:glycosyltransferase family 1 protein [Chloroflexia bacterium]
MVVGMDVSAVLTERCTGVGNYTANLLAGLRRFEKQGDLELLYFSNRCDYQGTGAKISGLEPGMVYERDRLPLRTAWLQLGLPRSLARTRPDLCHFPNYLAPVLQEIETPYLVTMYDMALYRFPQYTPLKIALVHQAIMPVVARKAGLIITASESARQDILHYLKLPPRQVRLIYGGVNPIFHTAPSSNEEAIIRQRYNLHFPYILMVGTLEPRKNHARLVQAYNQLIEQEHLPHHLVLVGPHGWKEGSLATEVARSKMQERIHFPGYVPTEDLAGLYRAAAAFAFPSLHEGFGLPILEAMACGTPTLISNDPALLEVSGSEAGVVVNPYSVDDMAGGLYRLLTDSALVERLRMRGPIHARQYTWEECARQTVELYEEMVSSRPASALSRPNPNNFTIKPAGKLTPQTTYRIDWWEPETIPVVPIIFNHPAPPVFAQAESEQEDITASALELAILETVLYADIFSFALNSLEIHHYLIGMSASLAAIQARLHNSAYLQKHLEKRGDYYYLKGHFTAYEQRQASNFAIEKQWRMARRWGKVLQAVPFLKTALITGSLAAGSAHPGDDLDLLLITEPGRLWTCRAFVIGVVYLARLSGLEICPNYLLAATDTALTIPERNLYTSREFAQMHLLFGEDNYRRLLNLNKAWVEETMPNALPYLETQQALLESRRQGFWGKLFRLAGERLLCGKLGEKLEQWEQRRKIPRLSHQEGAETRFTADTCKGHFGNYGRETLALFSKKRCRYLSVQASDTRKFQGGL